MTKIMSDFSKKEVTVPVGKTDGHPREDEGGSAAGKSAGRQPSGEMGVQAATVLRGEKGVQAPTALRGQKGGGDTLSDKDLFRRLVEGLYSPVAAMPGQEETRQLVTSRDLQYRYRDMCTVSVSTVAAVMQGLGYSFTFVLGMPYWVTYDRME